MTDRSRERESSHDGAATHAPVRAGTRDWLLGTIAVCAVVAAALGVVVAPGLHGNATDRIVDLADQASAIAAYAMAILVSAGVVAATTDLIASRRAETAAGAVVVAGSSLLVVLLVALIARARAIPDAPPQARLVLLVALVACSVASTSAAVAVRRPHTRALALLLFTFSLAAAARLGAWELATRGGEAPNPTLYQLGKAVATIGVLLEGAGQLAAAVWIGTRGRVGLVLSSLAAVAAFGLTLQAELGGHPDSSPLAAVLHTSLSSAATLPAPYGLSGAAAFLTLTSVLLGVACLALRGQPPVLVATFALALVSRGAFDAPLRAIAIGAAAQWALLAALDDRVLWASIKAASSSRGSSRPPAQAEGPRAG